MGLDISPGGAHWGYGSFQRFRERLAAEEGINLFVMEGFWHASGPYAYMNRAPEGFTGPAQMWEGVDGEYITPLAPLLNHSDCDGYIGPNECEEMLPRLREIIDKWDAEDPLKQDIDVPRARALIEGMEFCTEHWCALVFG